MQCREENELQYNAHAFLLFKSVQNNQSMPVMPFLSLNDDYIANDPAGHTAREKCLSKIYPLLNIHVDPLKEAVKMLKNNKGHRLQVKLGVHLAIV